MKLTKKKRKRLPSSAFAVPDLRAYPIHDKAHLTAAKARLTQHGGNLTASQRRKAWSRIRRAELKLVAKTTPRRTGAPPVRVYVKLAEAGLLHLLK